jgi:hypothetical protein
VAKTLAPQTTMAADDDWLQPELTFEEMVE